MQVPQQCYTLDTTGQVKRHLPKCALVACYLKVVLQLYKHGNSILPNVLHTIFAFALALSNTIPQGLAATPLANSSFPSTFSF